MDKDKTPIIYAPENRSRWLHILEKLLAGIFTLVLWFWVLRYIYNQLFDATTVSKSVDMMIFLLIATVVIFLVEAFWQFYNWMLFHGKDRRREFPTQGLDEVGELYGISRDHMETLQEIQRAAVVRYEDNRYYYCIEGQDPIEIVMLRENQKISTK